MLFDLSLDPAHVARLLGHANAAFTLSRYVGVRTVPTTARTRSRRRGEGLGCHYREQPRSNFVAA